MFMQDEYWKATMRNEYFMLQHELSNILKTHKPTVDQLESLCKIEYRLSILESIVE